MSNMSQEINLEYVSKIQEEIRDLRSSIIESSTESNYSNYSTQCCRMFKEWNHQLEELKTSPFFQRNPPDGLSKKDILMDGLKSIFDFYSKQSNLINISEDIFFLRDVSYVAKTIKLQMEQNEDPCLTDLI